MKKCDYGIIGIILKELKVTKEPVKHMMFFTFLIVSSVKCQYVTTIAGSGTPTLINGQGVAATFNQPWGLIVGLNDNIFVTDYLNNVIRKINSTGFVSTYAGSASIGSADGQGRSASFYLPVGIHADSIGNLYIADNNNQLIRLINATGYVTTVAGSGAIGSADGQSTSASFNYPFGIWFDSSSNNIYFADQWNNKIRMINSSGYVTTIAGKGESTFLNGQGLNATFNGPNGIVLDANKNIYVADFFNHAIRIINSTGFVSTYAGNGRQGATDGYYGAASLNGPMGLSIDSLGNLYVADNWNHRIRMINSSGYVRTIAGKSKGYRDGYGENAEFNLPIGVATDSIGNVYVVDSFNNRIRKIDMNYTATTTIQSTTSHTSVSINAFTIAPSTPLVGTTQVSLTSPTTKLNIATSN